MSHPVDPRARVVRRTGELLVTGATGCVGRAVCRRLGELGIRYRALLRQGGDRGVLDGAGGWMIEGDLTDPGSLPGALDGVSAVIHAAGVTRWSERDRARSVIDEGGAHLLAAATGVERIVAIGCASVGRAGDPFGQAHAAHEANLRRWTTGTRSAVLLRCPTILGPGSAALELLERLARLPVLPLPPELAPLAPLWADDVAAAALAALDLPTAGLLPLELAGAEAWAIPRILAALRGRGVPLLPMPRAAAAWAARLAPRLGLPLDAQRLALARAPLDPGPARIHLGWQPRPTAEVLDLAR